MPRLRRNGGLGQLEPREGVVTHVPPEIVQGGRGTKTPMGTREHNSKSTPRPEPIRNGLPFTKYDPSAEARARRAADPRYAAARRALAEAARRFGPPPRTIRGLPGADQFQKYRRAARARQRAAAAL